MVLVYAIVKAQDYGWGSARTLGLGARRASRCSPRSCSSSRARRRRSCASASSASARSPAPTSSMLLVAGGMFAIFFFASLYVQQMLGYSPLEAGLAFLPFTLGIIVGAGVVAG